MPPTTPTSYPNWKAPSEDGQTLIWPDAQQILADTRENYRRLTSQHQVLIQNVPLPELRKQQRTWIGHTADDDQPVIASGHQTELHHPGVWVKDVLANQIASKLNGAAYNFAVDTDSPKHLNVRWPGVNEPITDDPALTTAEWSGQLDSPTPAHVSHLQSKLENSAFNFRPILNDFLDSLRRLALESPKLPAALTNATHELNWSLGLRHHAMLCSPIFDSPPYLVLAHHIIARAAKFAQDYNTALAEYRRINKVRNATRPMPDLQGNDTFREVPFWLDHLATGHRTRATVALEPTGARLVLATGADFFFDPSVNGFEAANSLQKFLRTNELRLSPRALTLTLFLRLLIADEFIHGIGGARYDQVTDHLIQSHFRIKPPSFAVTTATLYFPDAVNRPRACLPCIESEGHHLRHALLGPRKRELVAAITNAPRYSSERRQLFSKLHQELATASINNPLLANWQQRRMETEQAESEDATLFDRELFFALQPRDRLEQLIARYNTAFTTNN